MKLPHLLLAIVISAVSFLPACEEDKTDSSFGYYSQQEYQTLSQNLNLPQVPFEYKNINAAGDRRNSIITLGRVLFYDKNLSKDNTVSCGSCHQQHLAFADDKAFSKGILNRNTARNSIALGVFIKFESYTDDPRTTLFWDGRVDNLHDQMIQTMRNPKEMGMEINEIENKIKDFDYYKILTQKAFYTENLTSDLILKALENFMNSITSQSSKFDNVSSNLGPALIPAHWPGYNNQENLGKDLFQHNCVNCHQQGFESIPNFITFDAGRNANNGLDLVYKDKGAGEHDPSPYALAIFKIPSLRNIELTAPYMHDGRFNTLEEVINFYSDGIQDHPNLNQLLKEDGHPKKFNFTANEKDALIQFLKTLTDHTMIKEAKWSDPFL